MGEGGGQILRTSISLSAVTGKPVEVTNIRAKRQIRGLRPQHMTAIRIIADLFHADLENLQLGAEWISFAPSDKFKGGSIKVDIGTAGSIPMILMAVVPAVSLSGKELKLEITGGTDVKASPTIDYIKHVVAPVYATIGIKFSVDVLRRGYYPKGGGIVRSTIGPCRSASTLSLLSTGEVAPSMISVSGMLPAHVTERQISSAMVALEKKGIRCKTYTAQIETSLSPGSSILIYSWSAFGPYVGGDSIGEVGKSAETVGVDAADRYLESSLVGATVDPFLSDMLVLPLALAEGVSKYRIARVTEHLLTNLKVASQLVGCKYSIERQGKTYIVSIEG